MMFNEPEAAVTMQMEQKSITAERRRRKEAMPGSTLTSGAIYYQYIEKAYSTLAEASCF
jgi:hypothetical protein